MAVIKGNRFGDRPFVVQPQGANSSLGRAVEAAAARKVTKIVAAMADEVVAEANAIIDAEMVTDRSGRRRKKGQRHLKGSIVCEIDASNGFPITITARSKAETHKAAALEFGAKPHPIFASEGADRLAFPSTVRATSDLRPGSLVRQDGARPTSRSRVQGYNRGRGEKLARPDAVVHPGHPGFHYMQRALERVIRRRLSGKLK